MSITAAQALCLGLVLIAFLSAWISRRHAEKKAPESHGFVPMSKYVRDYMGTAEDRRLCLLPDPPPKIKVADHVALNWDRYFEAIAWMETRGEADPDQYHDEESGARGRYAITPAFWEDAQMPSGEHADCHVEAYARLTCIRYYQRYAPKGHALLDWDVMARIHRKGPSGTHSETAHRYASAVTALMRGGLNGHK